MTSFRIKFVPRNKKLWLPSQYRFAIRRTLI